MAVSLKISFISGTFLTRAREANNVDGFLVMAGHSRSKKRHRFARYAGDPHTSGVKPGKAWMPATSAGMTKCQVISPDANVTK
jgi:hypothetical protein